MVQEPREDGSTPTEAEGGAEEGERAANVVDIRAFRRPEGDGPDDGEPESSA